MYSYEVSPSCRMFQGAKRGLCAVDSEALIQSSPVHLVGPSNPAILDNLLALLASFIWCILSDSSRNAELLPLETPLSKPRVRKSSIKTPPIATYDCWRSRIRFQEDSSLGSHRRIFHLEYQSSRSRFAQD